MRIVVLGGVPKSLVNFRGRLLERLVSQGHEVIAAAGEHDGDIAAELQRMGVRFVTYPLARRGLNPLADLATCRALTALFTRQRTELVLAYTIKPVIWGGIAAQRARVPHFHALITGLGGQFAGGGGVRARLVAGVARRLYRYALRGASSVIFQNPDDRARFVAARVVPPGRDRLVPGSGVDMQLYSAQPLPDGSTTVFACIARLLAQKGLREYAEAARLVRERHPDTRFVLAGRHEAGGGGLSRAEIDGWCERGLIEFVGHQPHSRDVLAACHAFVLPSYYGEGVPRTTLEAMASARAVVTTDSPGCRETVVHGETGLAVPPRDAVALAEAMASLVGQRERLERMGTAGRERVREHFEVDRINDRMLEILAVP